MVMNKIEISQIEKPWGNFRQFTHNLSSTVKILYLKPNEMISLQSHTKRAEFWRIISGGGIVEIDGQKTQAKIADEYKISLNSKHRLIAGPDGIEVLEIATGDFDEDDIVRYEDKYGRIQAS